MGHGIWELEINTMYLCFEIADLSEGTVSEDILCVGRWFHSFIVLGEIIFFSESCSA